MMGAVAAFLGLYGAYKRNRQPILLFLLIRIGVVGLTLLFIVVLAQRNKSANALLIVLFLVLLANTGIGMLLFKWLAILRLKLKKFFIFAKINLFKSSSGKEHPSASTFSVDSGRDSYPRGTTAPIATT